MRIVSLTFLCAALVAGAVRPGLAQHSAVEPAARGDDWAKRRFDQLTQRVKEHGATAQLVFLGDSITEGWEGAGKDVWARYYGHRHALNLGIGGDRTQHVLHRLAHGHFDGVKPKAIVLMIGTNNSNGEDNTPGQIVDGIAAIVRALREKAPEAKILLLAIFPRSENFTPQRGKLLMINQVIRKLADDQHVFWHDFGHELVNADGLIPRELMPDYLHLSPQGYALWARAIEPQLAALLGDRPVPPVAAADPSGDWIWTIRGPEGEDLHAPLVLKADGPRLSGKFSRGPDRWLEFEHGKIEGNAMTFTVKRDRPGGGEMVYEMKATLEGDRIRGTAKTTLDGNEVNADWSARRP